MRSWRFWVKKIVNTAWDLELVSFMLVAATVRALLPSSIRSWMSWYEVTASFDKSSTYGPSSGCSRTFRLPLFFGFSRSRTRSQ
uniref:Putative secreted peptide n=1 Tax=Anopheles braziliensis TaxID=58242 RepID=A0A2M3ZUA1_9DIPT